MRFAQLKLTGSRTFEEIKPSLEVKFAILSSRLALELEPLCKSSRDMADRLVAGHMAVAYHVPNHNEYMRAGYPSEPILAEAAAHSWVDFEKFEPSIPRALRDVVSNHFMSKGERGELVARYILIRAQDLAMKSIRCNKQMDRIFDPGVPFSEAVPL